MSRPRRGGLGRGLGALIPSSSSVPSETVSTPSDSAAAEDADVMSTGIADAKGTGAQPVSDGTAGKSGPSIKVTNRVPSLAAISASSATDFYFEPAPVPGATLRELLPSEITMNPKQPRTVFDEEALEELKHSIAEFGVLQPIVVRPKADGFELVMGERRLRAAIAAGLATIPAIVRETGDDAMLRDALLENIHRAQLNPLEEAAAYQQLLEEFGATHDELAARIGRSRSQVTNTIRLMNLPVAVQRRVAAGVLSAGHARALLGLGSREQQDDLAGRIVAEGLSVRATEELVAVTDGATSAQRGVSRRKAAPRFTAPAVEGLAGKLSDVLDTHVRVEIGRRKGKITIEFGSVDDLERIVAVIAPELATKPRSDPNG
ncbi:MAG: parB [Frankiales bacterium]|nr:parB [Frankiales bacterium]